MICFHLDETHELCMAHENMAAQPTTYVLQIALEWAAGREKPLTYVDLARRWSKARSKQ